MSTESRLVLDRRRAALRAALTGLNSELDAWKAASDEDQFLEKHHRQIRRLANQLTAVTELHAGEERSLAEASAAITTSAGASSATHDGLLSRCDALEREILSAHSLWEFFRSRLALRYVPSLRDYLVVADSLAWECYRTVREHVLRAHIAPEDVKEPPLVHFSGEHSPYILPRNRQYAAEAFPGRRVGLPTSLAPLVQQLPIPVIAIPWHTTRFLPAALLVCHEAGHAIEDDFRLTDRLKALLTATSIPDERRPAWKAWLGEVFADLCGTLATGPAFVGTLSDTLAQAADTIQEERLPDLNRFPAGRGVPEGWGWYPTRTLRVLFACEVLRQIGFNLEAERRATAWRGGYPTHAMAAFEEDLQPLVTRLLQGPYSPELDRANLGEVLGFTDSQQMQARRAAEALIQGVTPIPTDVRVLFAAARLAFEQDPTLFDLSQAHERMLQRMVDIQEKGILSGPAPPRTAEEDVRIEKHDASAGQTLRVLLRGTEVGEEKE